MKTTAFLFASTMLAASPAAAQEEAADAAAEQAIQDRDHVHQEAEEDIIVTAPFVRDLNILAGTEVLSGTELVREMRPQLGDTLARLPGVSATSFSPGASRPVLRGFQGERVRVLVDGIGSIDVSNTSADHAVTIDPITAHRIEVLHGPAALLFGSQAIGGAVNVFDRRIPRRTADPPESLHVDAVAAFGSAARERSAGAGVDLPFGDTGLVLHFDGSYRNSDDLRIGGFVLSPAARAEQLAIADQEAAEGHADEAAEAREFAALRGRLPNSATETETAGVGLALLRDNGNLGFSISYYGSRYGVPARPGGGHHHEEEEGGHAEEADVAIDLKQIRADLRGEVTVGGGLIDRIRIRAGFADYQHTEFEGEEVGTIFRTEGMEGRFELVQAERGAWRGATGAQFFTRKLAAIGAEAFVPPNSTEQIGVFTLQELELGALELEAAARFERSKVGANTIGFDRSFDALSFAVGGSYEVARRVRAGLNLSRAERAPSPEELLSDGPHIATQSFERGDPGLDTEKSLGAELYLRADRPGYNLSASLFVSRFDDYIFQTAGGEVEDGLPVFQYVQRDATYWGFEIAASATLARLSGFRIVADTVADHVRATIGGGGPAPRIPPLRVLVGVEAQSSDVDARFEVERVFAQKRVGAFERPTAGFNMVNASVAWRPWGRRNPSSIVFSANNILDVDARRHASFTREFVPLPGRDLRVSARVSF